MQVGRDAIVLRRARKVANRHLIVAAKFTNRMQRLMQIADEVYEKF
jgi:hypothetical protein